ncbi:MAG: hypothetical protein HFE63_06270 [Clostridiales bacterium]|nr:hypothetical protein [Clostridiales bacterium]
MKKNKQNYRLTAAALIAALIIPLINTILLGAVNISVSTNVIYPEIVSDIIEYAMEIIGVICVFATASCICTAVIKNESKTPVAAIAISSVPILYIAAMIVDLAFYSNSALGSAYILTNGVNCTFELVRILLLLLVCSIVRRSAQKKQRENSLELFSLKGSLSRAIIFSSITIFITLIVADAVETLTLLIEFGGPQNTNELVYLILPYITAIVYSLLGYLLMYLTMKLIYKKGKVK